MPCKFITHYFLLLYLQGVGLVKITNNGKSGKLVDVLRSTNTVDNVTGFSVPNGHSYGGAERSDIHAAAVIDTSAW